MKSLCASQKDGKAIERINSDRKGLCSSNLVSIGDFVRCSVAQKALGKPGDAAKSKKGSHKAVTRKASMRQQSSVGTRTYGSSEANAFQEPS